jgi:hypothetical protein
MTEAQKKAYVIADNKLALNAGWDLEVLKLELDALVNDGFNVELTGFSLNELTDLIDPVLEKEEIIKDENYESAFSIIIDCNDEQEQEKIFNELDSKGYKCRVQSL